MKKLDLSNIVEGVRELGAVKQFIQHMEDAYVKALAHLTKGLVNLSGSYIVCHGCVNAGVGLNYDISAGAILKDGEIYFVPAFVGVAVGADVPRLTLAVANGQLQYTDSTAQNTLTTRTFAWVIGSSGSGLVDFANLVLLTNAIGVGGKLSNAAGAVGTNNLADGAVTKEKVDSTITIAKQIAVSGADLDDLTKYGLTYILGSATSNAPNAEEFLVIAHGTDQNGQPGQIAIQVTGAVGVKGRIWERHVTSVFPTVWSAWAIINDPAA